MADSADPHFHERLIEAGYPHVYWKKDDHPWEEKGNYFEKTVDYATVKESHWQRVKNWWQTAKNNRRLEKENNTCMNLEALERMNLHFLQKQLLDNVASYVWDGPERKTDATAKTGLAMFLAVMILDRSWNGIASNVRINPGMSTESFQG
jgi:hypothetical protein